MKAYDIENKIKIVLEAFEDVKMSDSSFKEICSFQ